jgi:predicted outer membrane protein
MNLPLHSPPRIAFRLTSSLALLAGVSALAIVSARAEPVPGQPPGEQPSTPDAPLPSRPAEDFKSQSPGAEKKPDRALVRVLVEVAAASTESNRLSQLAARRAAHVEVRDFADQVTHASQTLVEEIDRIADARNVSVRSNAAGQEEEWDAPSGQAFDESYLRRTRRLHEDAIAALEEYTGHTDADPQITAFAEQHLPGLHRHLRQAENLDERVSRNPEPRRDDLIVGETSPHSSSLRHPPVVLAFHEESVD